MIHAQVSSCSLNRVVLRLSFRLRQGYGETGDAERSVATDGCGMREREDGGQRSEILSVAAALCRRRTSVSGSIENASHRDATTVEGKYRREG